jgi:hypothetical protein
MIESSHGNSPPRRAAALESLSKLVSRTKVKIREATHHQWGRGRSFTYGGKRYTNLVVNEKHYTVAEIATLWGSQRTWRGTRSAMKLVSLNLIVQAHE